MSEGEAICRMYLALPPANKDWINVLVPRVANKDNQARKIISMVMSKEIRPEDAYGLLDEHRESRH